MTMKTAAPPLPRTALLQSPLHQSNEEAETMQTANQFHEIECAWVPGTTDRVRFTLLRQGKDVKSQVRELAVARLATMFGRTLMDDLYLRGRARLRLSDRQLLELA
ncbi:hypothetical protein [Deinococcus altitudinis]|uniref:hypothetical protein n=1 Tax=Deinococcus altitudinis TaxID=468914 RepID=UPI0038925A58